MYLFGLLLFYVIGVVVAFGLAKGTLYNAGIKGGILNMDCMEMAKGSWANAYIVYKAGRKAKKLGFRYRTPEEC